MAGVTAAMIAAPSVNNHFDAVTWSDVSGTSPIIVEIDNEVRALTGPDVPVNIGVSWTGSITSIRATYDGVTYFALTNGGDIPWTPGQSLGFRARQSSVAHRTGVVHVVNSATGEAMAEFDYDITGTSP